MRVRLAALALLSLTAAGCGTASLQAGGGQATASATASVTAGAAVSAPAAQAPSAGATPARASGTAVPTASPGGACRSEPAQSGGAGAAAGLEFVSARQGWAVVRDTVLATADGGARWTPQFSGTLTLTAVDFVNGRDGWVTGTTSLLATTDGGAHWTPLPEPCPVIRSVHFISPATGFAVAGGTGLEDAGGGPAMPAAGGVVLATSDGGHSWHPLAAPPGAQTICFSDPEHGWLGAAGRLYRTSDGGLRWSGPLTSAAAGTQAGYAATMTVQCAGDGTAWALRVGPGAGMSQDAHTAYHAGQSGVTGVFAEQYWRSPGDPAAEAPGSYAGPFSALGPSAAVFVDFCPACGAGTAPWDVVTGSGAALAREGNVGDISQPEAASFLSPQAGWVAGTVSEYRAGQSREQYRIVGTADGGRTWRVEYATPWANA